MGNIQWHFDSISVQAELSNLSASYYAPRLSVFGPIQLEVKISLVGIGYISLEELSERIIFGLSSDDERIEQATKQELRIKELEGKLAEIKSTIDGIERGLQ